MKNRFCDHRIFLFPLLLFLIHIACLETHSVSFKVLKGEEEEGEGGKWSSELVYLDLIDVKGSIWKREEEEEQEDEEGGKGGRGKDADDLFYVIGMEMKKPLEMVVQGFLRFELRNGTFVNDLKASNGIQLQSNGSFHFIQTKDSDSQEEEEERGFKLKIHSKLRTRDQVEVTYDLECERRVTCPRILLNHSLTSFPPELVTFQSDAIETCHNKSSDGHHDHTNIPSDLVINILLQSHIFPLLNTKLEQIFVFNDNSSGWESMNATNSIADIKVRADWNEVVHLKSASILGKMFNIPSFDVEYSKDDGYSLHMKTTRFKRSSPHEEL